MRLVLPNKEVAYRRNTEFGLPIEESFNIEYYKRNKVQIAEISRVCIKNRFKGSKTVFYLWRELISFAISKGITDLIANVNPETDKLCDAYLIYQLVKSNNLLSKKILVRPKRPGIGKVRNFRFPLTKRPSCNQEDNKTKRVDIQMPQTLKLFDRVGLVFTGEPAYCEKIDMCAMPMNWNLRNIENSFIFKFGKDRSIN